MMSLSGIPLSWMLDDVTALYEAWCNAVLSRDRARLADAHRRACEAYLLATAAYQAALGRDMPTG